MNVFYLTIINFYFCTIQLLIVSITKFSIVIGSPRAYLSRARDHVGVQLQVSDLKFL